MNRKYAIYMLDKELKYLNALPGRMPEALKVHGKTILAWLQLDDTLTGTTVGR